jgi:mercuric ion transport protein
VLFSLGVSGAWIGTLTALEPYKPVFIAITLGFLGCGYWLVHRMPTIRDDDAACAKPLPIQVVKSALWISTALVLLAMFWNWIAPVIAPIMLGL